MRTAEHLQFHLPQPFQRTGARRLSAPAKQQSEQKIDAAVALMIAVGRAMAEDGGQGDLMDFLRNPVIA